MTSATPLATTPHARRRALGALGMDLARRGPLAVGSLVIGALTIAGALAVTASMMRRGARSTFEEVPSLTAGALAWGAGVLLAFAVSVHALKRDREAGIMALLRARGASLTGYLWTRVGGLTAWLVVVVAGGTLLVGLVATLLAARAGTSLRTLQGTGAAVAYAVAFALTLGPLAMAALGSRSRAGGYGWLLLVLVLPELLAPITSALLPYGFGELASIPGALTALRAALMPPGVDAWRATKALFVLTLVVAVSLAAVRRAARRAQREEAP
jgi:hypothetical protein